MELKDLVGVHELDAVDFSNEKVKTWGDEFEDCQVMRFRLDGVVYSAVEDPSDGYRSSMRNIDVSDATMTNIFPSVKVLAKHQTKGEYGEEDDILELIDLSNGQTIVRVGTSNVSDYYPYFVSSFMPENIAYND